MENVVLQSIQEQDLNFPLFFFLGGGEGEGSSA